MQLSHEADTVNQSEITTGRIENEEADDSDMIEEVKRCG